MTVRKQAINDILQGTVVTYLRCDRIVKLRKVYCRVFQRNKSENRLRINRLIAVSLVSLFFFWGGEHGVIYMYVTYLLTSLLRFVVSSSQVHDSLLPNSTSQDPPDRTRPDKVRGLCRRPARGPSGLTRVSDEVRRVRLVESAHYRHAPVVAVFVAT